MTLPIDQVCGASLAPAALAVLASLRRRPDIGVTVAGDHAWVRWQPGDEQVLRRLLPVPGVELYVHRDGLWYRHGCRLPSFGLPLDSPALPLHRAIVPSPAQPELAPEREPRPRRLRLVRHDRPRGATAMRCEVAELGPWADQATTAQLAAIRAARSGTQVLLLGGRLPAIPGGERFWGESVLAPLGFRPEPALPEAALRQALTVADDDLLVLGAAGPEVVPRGAFQPLTRAGIRLAWMEQGG